MEEKITDSTNINSSAKCCNWKRGASSCGASSGAYCLGVIGAAVYFVMNAATFWAGVLGILKAIVWPAIVVFKLLEFLSI